MMKKRNNRALTKLTIKELREHLSRREKVIKGRINKLDKKRKSLLKQVEKVEEETVLLKSELAIKTQRKPKVKKVARRKAATGKKASIILKRGILKNAMIQIVGSSKSPMSPKQVQDAVIAKRVYKKAPKYISRIVFAKLKDPAFKKVGKGKYTLRKDHKAALISLKKLGKREVRKVLEKKKEEVGERKPARGRAKKGKKAR